MEANAQEVERIVEEIRAARPEAGKMLADLASGYDYETIFEMIEEALKNQDGSIKKSRI